MPEDIVNRSTFLSKKGNHIIDDKQSINLTKNAEKITQTRTFVLTDGLTDAQVQQIINLLKNEKITVEQN